MLSWQQDDDAEFQGLDQRQRLALILDKALALVEEIDEMEDMPW